MFLAFVELDSSAFCYWNNIWYLSLLISLFHTFYQQEINHFHVPYLKNFLKKLISEVELSQVEVLDEFYELYAHYMVSCKDENLGKGSARISKFVSFLFPDGSLSFQNLRKFVVPLQCSLNMLEGARSGLQVYIFQN